MRVAERDCLEVPDDMAPARGSRMRTVFVCGPLFPSEDRAKNVA